MKAAEWIDRAKAIKGWTSDYRAAKELHLSRNTISTYRAGRSDTMDEETSVRVAHAIGLNPAGVVLDQAAERAKDQTVRTTLAKLADQLCILCKVASESVAKTPRGRFCAALML